MLPEGGLLDGLLSPRFILVLLACLFKLYVQILFAIFHPIETPTVFTTFGTLSLYLPGFITGVISTWHRGLLKTFLNHPSLLFLPTFSYFTFESNTPKFCAKSDPSNDVEIKFSVKWTYLNITFSVTILLAFDAVSTVVTGAFQGVPFLNALLFFLLGFLVLNLLPLLPGILLTITFLCISSPPKDCSSSCFAPLEINI